MFFYFYCEFKSKTMRKIILSVILITILVLSVFSIYLFPESTVLGAHVVPLKLDTGDTAWMLVATGLVLLMTPGLGFFYGGMVGKKNVISTVLHRYCFVGCGWIWLVFWAFN
jgi:Amt family ammonium transporter